jgi:hypothetical protein
MALRPQFSLINSEFNEFLFASVGEEKTGLQLTVLSALTRLDLDPWAEAARLSELPKEAASRVLGAAIALLPQGDWKAADLPLIAARLVTSLPRRSGPSPPSPQTEYIRVNTKSGIALWFVCVALAFASIFAMWHLQADPAHEAVPATVSSTQR